MGECKYWVSHVGVWGRYTRACGFRFFGIALKVLWMMLRGAVAVLMVFSQGGFKDPPNSLVGGSSRKDNVVQDTEAVRVMVCVGTLQMQ